MKKCVYFERFLWGVYMDMVMKPQIRAWRRE